MAAMARVIEHVLLDKLFSGDAPLASRGGNIGQGAFVLSVFFITLGSGFLMYGLHMWLTQNYTPEAAALTTGAISLVVAAIIGASMFMALQYKRSRLKKVRHEIAKKIESAVEVLDDQFGDPIRENPKASLLIATLAGFFLEDRIL